VPAPIFLFATIEELNEFGPVVKNVQGYAPPAPKAVSEPLV
jgi:hypothetical protein